jgi:hypothetical protein
MNPLGLNGPPPQFGTAEYIESPGRDQCQFCQQPISGQYYRVNGATACSACAEKAITARPAYDHANFIRALFFGVGAAAAGLILYATFEIVTGWIIGYLSLAVGWMVGKAMMKGSNGQGGRRYQVAAVLLTYAAVSLSAIPIWIHYQSQRRAQITQQQKLADEQRELEQGSGRETQPAPSQPAMNRGKALLMLGLLGLASPFLELSDPIHGLIGLFILSIGIRIAWQLTGPKTPPIDGPFRTAGAA